MGKKWAKNLKMVAHIFLHAFSLRYPWDELKPKIQCSPRFYGKIKFKLQWIPWFWHATKPWPVWKLKHPCCFRFYFAIKHWTAWKFYCQIHHWIKWKLKFSHWSRFYFHIKPWKFLPVESHEIHLTTREVPTWQTQPISS